MLKKIIALVLVCSIFTVSAQASSHAGLKAAFDELNYSLTVEWDQKDMSFKETQMNSFKAELSKLQAQGLSNAQLIEFVKKEVKNEKVAKDLETAFNMISINKMSPSEASQYMIETMQKSYSNGASWSGAGFVVGVFVAVLVIAAAVAGGVVVYEGPSTCGYSTYYCGTTCYGLDCDPNYCCW